MRRRQLLLAKYPPRPPGPVPPPHPHDGSHAAVRPGPTARPLRRHHSPTAPNPKTPKKPLATPEQQQNAELKQQIRYPFTLPRARIRMRNTAGRRRSSPIRWAHWNPLQRGFPFRFCEISSFSSSSSSSSPPSRVPPAPPPSPSFPPTLCVCVCWRFSRNRGGGGSEVEKDAPGQRSAGESSPRFVFSFPPALRRRASFDFLVRK